MALESRHSQLHYARRPPWAASVAARWAERGRGATMPERKEPDHEVQRVASVGEYFLFSKALNREKLSIDKSPQATKLLKNDYRIQ
ncbi:Protein of unknown function [Gryllus bimaculatus]|nr:Protein of unknown function [Gryllus bimaculatus]